MLTPRHTTWLLIFFAMLIAGHLAIIFSDVYLCAWYGMQQVNEGGTTALDLSNTGCPTVEETYQQAVDKYLAIVLALLGGGAAGVAMMTGKRKDDDDGPDN